MPAEQAKTLSRSQSMDHGAVRPILKHSTSDVAAKRPRKGLVWDEETIAAHDLERGQYAKIDEPKTPFHTLDGTRPLDDEGIDGMQIDSQHHADHPADDEHQHSPRSPREAAESANAKLFDALHEAVGKAEARGKKAGISEWEEDSGGEASSSRRVAAGAGRRSSRDSMDRDSAPGDDDDEEDHKHSPEHEKEFKTHRKQHYDEFKKLLDWKKKHARAVERAKAAGGGAAVLSSSEESEGEDAAKGADQGGRAVGAAKL
eukprot:tig00020685_g12928.t1